MVRVVGVDEPGRLPGHAVLAATARALNDTGQWAYVCDAGWNTVYLTDEARRIYGGRAHLAPYVVGEHWFSGASVDLMLDWPSGQFPMEIIRSHARVWLPVMLGDARGGHEELRRVVDPRLRDILDEVEAVAVPQAWSSLFEGIYSRAGDPLSIQVAVLPLRDEGGARVGSAAILKPDVGMAAVARLTARNDREHLERVERVAKPERHAAAILFADLESSSALARRLATASFFSLVRRVTRSVDQAIVDAGGIAGQHAGDGVVGFFLVSELGSASAAAAACIAAARAMRDALAPLAARSELDTGDLQARFGLHWGSNLYVGQIATSARTEVTALGDQVNEAARIEACAGGGRMLASKDLVERLDPGDAATLGLDPDHMTYTTLADLATASEKARRDAPAIAVCEL